MHGGLSIGAPIGNQNAFKHGRYTAAAIAERRWARKLMDDFFALVKSL